MLRLVPWLVFFRALGKFCVHRHTRYTLAWLLALGTGATVWQQAHGYWDSAKRSDGFAGHTTVDFGSSYVMGRMVVCGESWYLYDRMHMRNVLVDAYPRTDEEPTQERSDAHKLMGWFMGEDSREGAKTFASSLTVLAAADGPTAALLAAAGRQEAWTDEKLAEAAKHRVGGPLYPPINAFLAAPMALLPPREAYYVHQIGDLVLVLLCGWGISLISGGRLWAPVAATVLLLYPGYFGGLHLSQTSTTALTFFVWGWVLIARGRPAWGGAVWGLLAFKPVWAVSFFLVLLLSRRWRACLGMMAAGAALIALTLPFVGLHSWLDWLEIGKGAADWYKIDKNWIRLSRDLLGLPRRYLLDFTIEDPLERDVPQAGLIGWTLLLIVLVVTAGVALLRPRAVRAVTGPGAAFLLLGGWLCCFHFMYYDVVLTFLPVMLLLADPRRYLRPRLWERQPLQWERRVLPGRQRWGAARALAAAIAVFRLPTTPPQRGREVAVLRLPARTLYGWLRNSFALLMLLILLAIEGPLRTWGYTSLSEPLDTYMVIFLWAWCGAWVWWKGRALTPRPSRRVPLRQEAAAAQSLPGLSRASADGLAVTPAPAR
jgi:hypothetical protein